MNRVLNKVIIVTGGASGIGQATCSLLAQEGATIALVDINDKAGINAVKLIQEQGGKAAFWHMDASKEIEVKQVISQIAERFGQINGLVNNVGIIGSNNPTHEFSEED